MTSFARELPFGATLVDPGHTHFRLWAPGQLEMAVEVEGLGSVPMTRDAGGWFDAEAACGAGARYRFRLADGLAVPDPASRAQGSDVHDPSLVVDPRAYRWRHPDWRGRKWPETVLYELHAGSLGGFAGVAARLPDLAGLGITAVELMPVNDFPGQRNWGYDGVLPFAPDAAYGAPDELKALVDAAHGLGLMIFLDVVYNHFGPDGNYLAAYAPRLLPHRHRHAVGCRHRFPPARGAPLLHRERPLLADGIPLRRPALRRRARHRRTRLAGRDGGRGPRHGRAGPPRSSRARARRQRGRPSAPGLRRPVERRCPPCPACPADRRGRRLLCRLCRAPGRAPGPLPRRRLRLPGRALGLPQGRAPRHAQRRSAAHRLRDVPAEPRPGRQPAVRRPAGRARRWRDARGGDRPAAPLPAGPAHLHGRGGREPHALPVLHRPSRRARQGGARRPTARVRSLQGLPRRRDSRTRSPIPTHSRPSRAATRSPTMPTGARCTASCWRCAPLPWRRILPARVRFRRRLPGRPASRRAGVSATVRCWRWSAISAATTVRSIRRRVDLLFESRAGASEDVRAGRLAGPATVAFLDPAAKGNG